MLYSPLNILFPKVESRKSHRQPPDHYLPSRPWLSGRTIDRLRMQLPNWCARSTALRTRLSMQGIALAKFQNGVFQSYPLHRQGIIEFMYATAQFRIIAIVNRAFETESLGTNSVSTISSLRGAADSRSFRDSIAGFPNLDA